MTVKATDAYGNEINVGDIIAYPGRQSSSMWMNTAVVTGIEDGPTYGRQEPQARVKVVSIKKSFEFMGLDAENKRQYGEIVSTRKTYIDVTDRVVPVDEHKLPGDIGQAAAQVLSSLRTPK